MRPLGRMLAKIMHASPLAVAEQLIRQVGGCAEPCPARTLTGAHARHVILLLWMLTRLLALLCR